MEKFRELYIKVDSQHTGEFVKAVDAVLANGWSRAHDSEQRAKETGGGDSEFVYYYCDKREKREGAMVAIYRRDAETLYVSNVVPTELTQLNHGQYNHILQDFNDVILAKIRAGFPITVMLASNQLRIEDMMSAEAFSRLKKFSASANKSTGSAHPSDRERWLDFLTRLHHDKHRLDTSSLIRWLVEIENWPAAVAQDLAIEFEFAIELLKFKAK